MVMKKKIKVLLTVGSMGIGGNEVFVLNLVENLNRDEFEVGVLIFSKLGISDENISRLKKCGCKLFIGDSLGTRKDIIRDSIFVSKVVKDNKYDIVHCNSCSLIGLLKVTIPLKLQRKVKVISHSHNSGNNNTCYLRKLMVDFMKIVLFFTVDFGLACSDKAAEAKYTNKFINSPKYRFINNSIDTKKYIFDQNIRSKIRNGFDIQEDEFLIGNVGRFDYQKNQEFLLKVMDALNKEGFKFKCILIGDGENNKYLHTLSEKLNISNKIIFTGNRSDVNLLYSAMDCFVMTSRYEGFPFVLTEAQVNGLYCIVSDVISKDVNVTGEVKFLSLNDDYNIWAKQIRKINRLRMSDESRNRIIMKYDITYEVKEIQSIYKRLYQ